MTGWILTLTFAFIALGIVVYHRLTQRILLLEDLLVTWAVHWQDPPADLQRKLLTVVQRIRPEKLPPPQSMGMDGGLGLLWAAIRRGR
jgi:hypothetical protein